MTVVAGYVLHVFHDVIYVELVELKVVKRKGVRLVKCWIGKLVANK